MQEVYTFDVMQYVLSFTKDYEIGKKYPVLLFLHGAGTRGTDIHKLMDNPFFLNINRYEEFPLIVAAPLCHADTRYDIFSDLLAFLQHIRNKEFTDASRIYGMGASMGDMVYGNWQ